LRRKKNEFLDQRPFILRLFTGVLRYLHENRVAHRDLKLENWLFRSKEDDDQIVLIDFGLSHKYRPEGLPLVSLFF